MASGASLAAPLASALDPLFAAHAKFRRRDFDGCIAACTALLAASPYDQAVWFLKSRALTEKSFIDDSDWDEEGIAEVLLDDNAIAQAPRPGTSLQRASTGASSAAGGMRPLTASGRPVTGFARPGTSSLRPLTASSRGAVETAFRGARPGTSRAMTALGRAVRLGTASMLSSAGGPFIAADKLDLRRYAARPAIAKALFEYLWHVDHNPRKCIELAAAATAHEQFEDWWWKLRLGKCYYALGMLREAEKQLRSSLRAQEHISTYLELGKLYIKMDQPLLAQEMYSRGADVFASDTHIVLASARLNELVALAGLAPLPGAGDSGAGSASERAAAQYRAVLAQDAINVEALASLGAQSFYADQPEVALRHYRRLLQMGLQSAELWTNVGLCCFYAGQYDMCLSCFDRALGMASDEVAADVWYNVGQVAIGLGDVGLAYQACRIAIAVDGAHAESYNNLGVLEMRKGNWEAAKANFATAARLAEHLHEPLYNGAWLAYKLGDFEQAFALASKAQAAAPAFTAAAELVEMLRQLLLQ